MTRGIRRRRVVESALFLFPLVFLVVMWSLRSFAFVRYHAMVGEDRGLENAQFALYLAAGVVSVGIGARLRELGRPGLGWLFFMATGGLFLVAMEEISWGQRFLTLPSPAYFWNFNSQNEVNFHNLTTFQPYLHRAYLVIGGAITALCLLPRSIVPSRWRVFVPAIRLVFYFVPLAAFYAWFEYNKFVRGILIYAYDQEPAELLFSLGLLLVLIDTLNGLRHTAPPR